MNRMEDNIYQVYELIVDNWRINEPNIANKLVISIGSVETIVHLDLHYRKITERWVPRLFWYKIYTQRSVCIY